MSQSNRQFFLTIKKEERRRDNLPEVSSGERKVSSVNLNSKDDLPTLEAPVEGTNAFVNELADSSVRE